MELFSGLIKKNKITSIVVVAVLIVVIVSFFIVTVKAGSKSANSNTSQISVDPPKATQTLNKEFDFSVKDSNNQEITKIKYTIIFAQLTDQIVINGQKATAIAGRQFLVLSLKLTNDSTKDIQINTRDYIRLTVNKDTQDLLAPDIHNDPVDVQPISTKYTRLGFPINTTDKNLELIVGEINGPKQTINLSL